MTLRADAPTTAQTKTPADFPPGLFVVKPFLRDQG